MKKKFICIVFVICFLASTYSVDYERDLVGKQQIVIQNNDRIAAFNLFLNSDGTFLIKYLDSAGLDKFTDILISDIEKMFYNLSGS